jgi:GDP-mannose 6-dehydrogenase
LKPGYAFGGSCLPKDLRALAYWARSLDLEAPLLDSVLASNAAHQQRALSLVVRQGLRPVGLFGLSFKDGTDDLRESPAVELVERLIGKGYPVRIYDPSVSVTRLMGRNKAFIERELPHIASLLIDDVDELLAVAQTLVIAKPSSACAAALKCLRPGQSVVDLGAFFIESDCGEGAYHGLVG